MLQVTMIGLDIAKSVFHAHGVDERGAMVFTRKLSRGKLLEFFAAQPACVVAMEACGGAITGRGSLCSSVMKSG